MIPRWHFRPLPFHSQYYLKPSRPSIVSKHWIICASYLGIISKNGTLTGYASQTGRAHLLLTSRTPGLPGGAMARYFSLRAATNRAQSKVKLQGRLLNDIGSSL